MLSSEVAMTDAEKESEARCKEMLNQLIAVVKKQTMEIEDLAKSMKELAVGLKAVVQPPGATAHALPLPVPAPTATLVTVVDHAVAAAAPRAEAALVPESPTKCSTSGPDTNAGDIQVVAESEPEKGVPTVAPALEEMPLALPVTVVLDVDREGFCTPGIRMSIFSSLVNADKSKKLEPPNRFSKLTVSEAKRAFSGNLCRCTGYRPIVDVCKSFASDVDLEDLGLNIFWKKGGKQPDVSKLPSYTFGGGLCTFPDFLKSEIKSSLDYLNGAKSQSVPWPMFKCYEGGVQLKQPWPPPVPECIIRCVIVEMEVLTANLVARERHWVQNSKIVSYSSSCWQNSINAKTMRRCQETISELENCLKHELNIIVPSYRCWSSEDPTMHDKLLKRIILSSLTGNLALFSGHEIFGYQVISTDQAVKLHPSCSLLIYGSKPEFVVFTVILSVPNQYLVCVTAVDHDALCTIHPLSFIQRLEKHKLQMKVISGLGNSLLRKFCGKSAQNQQSIISFLKEDCRDERITIDIYFRNNEILLFATEDDMEKVFCIVNNALECEAKMLRNECLERSLFPGRHVNYTLALFGSGAEIKHLELEKRDLTVEVMHQNAHDINDRELICLVDTLISGVANFHKLVGNFQIASDKTKWGKFTFLKPENAEDAVSKLNGMEFHGSSLKVVPVCSSGVILICGAMYWACLLIGYDSFNEICYLPSAVPSHFHRYRFYTAVPFHGSLLHVLFNMLALVSLGTELERIMGSVCLLFLMFLLATTNAILNLIITFLVVYNPLYPVPFLVDECSIGSSGVIFLMIVIETSSSGVQSRSAFGLFNVPAKWYAWILLILFQFLTSNVSLLGHLCGILAGFAYTYGLFNYLLPGSSFYSSIEGLSVLSVCVRRPGFILYTGGTTYGQLPTYSNSGVDALEINFSCPHGMPEQKMGAAVGQDYGLLEEVCGWINEKATVPVWAKMTPNITNITQPARVALKSRCEGVSAINTIMSVMGINLKTLRPEPSVEGCSTPGGYSARAVHPIALAKVMQIARMMKEEFTDGQSISAIGGVREAFEVFQEKSYLVGVECKKTGGNILGTEESLKELEQLADTAGLLVAGSTYQKLSTPNPRTYIGSGKVAEIKSAIHALDAETVIFDDELSPGQLRNLEKSFGGGVRVCDRTALILDIFNQRAATHEAALQVTLAQMEYQLPRLTKMWGHLERQAGGQVKGMGEKQIEVDKRILRTQYH